MPQILDAIRGRVTRNGRIRVLVVDDSLVLRHLISQALGEDKEIEVVGAEADGNAALKRIPQVNPDVVTLDIEMPGMDGLETLRHIRKLHPHLRTVMFSTLTTRGGAATFEALSLGADDYVAKPSNSGSLDRSLGALREELIPKIKQFFHLPSTVAAEAAAQAAVAKPTVTTAAAAPASTAPATVAGMPAGQPYRLATPAPRRTKFGLVAIGVSTGGPQALAEVIPMLPANLGVPVLVVQHMPAMFTRLLAERLQATSALKVEEALHGMPIEAGRVVIARGDYHLKVLRVGSSMVVELDQSAAVNFCRPSVDVMFRSVAQWYRSEVLSVVLTGMGSDGLAGTQALKSLGAYSLVQDQETSVVWGMPGAVATAGLADRVVPLKEIAPEIVRLVKG